MDLMDETEEDRYRKSRFTEDDIKELQSFVKGLRRNGRYFASKRNNRISVITGRQAAKFWEAR